MKGTIGIAGAGVLGRMAALYLSSSEWKVTLFDRGDETGAGSCSHAAAGMLSPVVEREKAEALITELGIRSMETWRHFLSHASDSFMFTDRGSLVVSHPHDREELERLRRRIETSDHRDQMRIVHGTELQEIEPELDARFKTGLFFPHEAHLHNRHLLKLLHRESMQKGVTCYYHTEIDKVQSHTIITDKDRFHFDWVIDCRGLGAKENLTDLRGVRGEMVFVVAPEVHLSRPIRLMHPRYPIYIVPRPWDHYIIGATCIESEDIKPVTVHSALELLSAAYSVHSGFSEASILEMAVNCRPAFPDNLPRLYYGDGLLMVNGLYRHGFLISPAIVQLIAQFLERETIEPQFQSLFKEWNDEDHR